VHRVADHALIQIPDVDGDLTRGVRDRSEVAEVTVAADLHGWPLRQCPGRLACHPCVKVGGSAPLRRVTRTRTRHFVSRRLLRALHGPSSLGLAQVVPSGHSGRRDDGRVSGRPAAGIWRPRRRDAGTVARNRNLFRPAMRSTHTCAADRREYCFWLTCFWRLLKADRWR
jgi:hypothetical protein